MIKMHTLENSNSNVPAFLIKLWKLVEDSNCDDLISWSEDGNSFIIRDQATFAKKLLPQYFKHNNMASFIRQLNMYGFKKQLNYEKSGLNMSCDEMEFHHKFFVKGHECLLELIKRKMSSSKTADPAALNAKDLLTNLTTIREKQESMNTELVNMKKENELLWRELSAMRQKHKAQEQIIQKVIQFLVSIVQSGKQNIGMKRKLSRMIDDGPSTDPKLARLSRQLDVLRGNKNTDLFITVPQDKLKLTNVEGPVIHEVTDLDQEEPLELGSTVVLSTSQVDNTNSPATVECVVDSSSPANNVEQSLDSFNLLEPLPAKSPLLEVVQPPVEEQILGIPIDFPTASVISLPEELSPAASSSTAVLTPEMIDFSPSLNLSTETVFANAEEVVIDSANGDGTDMQEKENSPFLEEPTVNLGVSELQKCDSVNNTKHTPNLNVKDIMLNDSEATKSNYQLALSDSSCSSDPSFAKNILSNHVLNVDEELAWLKEHFNSGALNIDPTTLLGVCHYWDSWTSLDTKDDNDLLKDRDTNSIVGNELVQFTPSMLEFDLEGTPMFLDEYLNVNIDSLNDDGTQTKAECNDKTVQQNLMGVIKQENVSRASYGKSSCRSYGTSPKTPRGKSRNRRKK